MIALEWIKFLLGTAFLVGAVIVFAIEILGVFKFNYVLNRMHSGAAVQAANLSGEDADRLLFTLCSLALNQYLCFAPGFLIDNRIVGPGHHNPLICRVHYLLLIFVGFYT